MKTEKVRQLTGRRVRGRGWERRRIIRKKALSSINHSIPAGFLREGVTGLSTEQNNKTPEPGAPLLATSPSWTPPTHVAGPLTPFASSPLDFDRQPTTEVRIPYILLQHSHSLFHANNATIIGAFCLAFMFSLRRVLYKFSCSVAFASCFPVNCTVQVSSPAATPQTEDIVQESLAKGRTALLSPTWAICIFIIFYFRTFLK
jgi:hypothetical protein